VPRKRPELEREEKVEQILDRAVQLLREGISDLTINQIAEDLGLARGAVYWYFPSRDELFVAAAERLLTEAFAQHPTTGGHVRRITWAVDQLAEHHNVYAALQSRARTVPAAAELLDRFQRTLCDSLKQLLAPHVEASRLQGVADTIVMFIEGLLGRRLPEPARRRHLRFALAELVDKRPG
jgi:AcrR family transcriptional regulator